MIKNWIEAFRLRTLPLALSSILMGGGLALWQGSFAWSIFSLSILTTIFLQVLSNLANDYGDSIHGADSQDRKGPSRAVQTGVISLTNMKKAIYVLVVLSLISGISLLYLAFPDSLVYIGVFLAIGLLAIYAAITYTAGKKPYGYAGLGDISVFLFFGIVGVFGSNFLYTKAIDLSLLLPAISCGLLATGVLNVNNIRDIESDQLAGKKSIPVRVGRPAAIVYHFMLLMIAILAAVFFSIQNFVSWAQFVFLIAVPLLVINFIAVKNKTNAMDLDPYLKQLALTTLVFVLLFCTGLMI